MTEKIEIALSKKKLILTLFGAIGFVVVGFWFVINPPKISNPFFGNPTVIFVSGLASIVFFGLCAVVVARKLPDTKPGLIIDDIGIVDNSSGVSAGQILWSDIESISVIKINKQKLVMLHVQNPQHYIEIQASAFKRRMMKMNFNMYGSPLSITSNALQIDFNELLNILNNQLQASRMQTRENAFS